MSAKIRGEFYSTYSEIMKAISERRKDTELQKKVAEYLADDFPSFIKKDDVKAFFIRAIHTPNQEHFFFRDLAHEFNLEPIFCNYMSGKLVMRNSEKYHLAKVGLVEGFNKKGAMLYSYKNLLNINENEGKVIRDISLTNGSKLSDFHLDLFKDLGYTDTFFDMSEWFDRVRNDEDGYYAKFLALFLVNGVLFDNYLISDDSEKKFFQDKVWPAFNFIKEKFGVKPLIFPVLPVREENNSLFFFYNTKVQELIKGKI